MVFSDDFLHFLKIIFCCCRIHQNYLVALKVKQHCEFLASMFISIFYVNMCVNIHTKMCVCVHVYLFHLFH